MHLTPEQYDTAVEAVLAVLTRFDLMGLEPGLPDGMPADEYVIEARALVDMMDELGSVEFEHVNDIWLYWFGEDLSRLPPEAADDLVRSLNTAFQRARNE